MAISFTRPDPSSPSAVAAAAFTTSRKGFEPAEVREFLRMVAAELARLQEREKFLERELRTVQRGIPNPAVALDEEVVTRMLGEEAVRILHTAREAASQIKNRAEDGAARLLREATDEAQRLRTEAELESVRRRNDASADAESELEMAKQQGREMVNEARAYRERVLSELARRRELARQQIEQLIHGRDRLLQAFERARAVAVDVMGELTPLAEPTEYVDLSPTTGPVPIIVPHRPLHTNRPAETGDEESTPDVTSDADPTVPLGLTDPAPPQEVEPMHLDLVSDDVASDAVVLEIAWTVDSGSSDGTDEVASLVDMFSGAGEMIADETTAIDDTSDGATGDETHAMGPPDAEAADETVAMEGPDAEAGDETIAMEASEAEAAAHATVDAPDPEAAGDDTVDAQDAEAAHEPPVDDQLADEAAAIEHAPDETTAIELASEHDATSVIVRGTVDDLFARLRASRTENVARRVVDGTAPTPLPLEDRTGDDAVGEPPIDATGSSASEGAPAPAEHAPPTDDSVFLATAEAPPESESVDDTPFARRDAALTPVIVAAARKLKRVLADEQNEVLHSLRRRDPVRAVDAVLPSEHEHVARYVSALEAELTEAAIAGAVSMGATAGDAMREVKKAHATAAAEAMLATELVAPLRARLGRSVGDADGDNAELSNLVRVLYREWKTQRIDEHLDDVVRTAFGRGALAATTHGQPIRWIVDPNGPACPDAEDNALAGVVRAGERFPTDHVCAPAHSGCTCMIAPAAE